MTYLLNIYYVPGTLLALRIDEDPNTMELTFLSAIINKQIKCI